MTTSVEIKGTPIQPIEKMQHNVLPENKISKRANKTTQP